MGYLQFRTMKLRHNSLIIDEFKKKCKPGYCNIFLIEKSHNTTCYIKALIYMFTAKIIYVKGNKLNMDYLK